MEKIEKAEGREIEFLDCSMSGLVDLADDIEGLTQDQPLYFRIFNTGGSDLVVAYSPQKIEIEDVIEAYLRENYYDEYEAIEAERQILMKENNFSNK
jgi:hypothetical protein